MKKIIICFALIITVGFQISCNTPNGSEKTSSPEAKDTPKAAAATFSPHELPGASPVLIDSGRKYIDSYQYKIKQHPSSFLIKADDGKKDNLEAGDLFNYTIDHPDCFFHIYFGSRNKAVGSKLLDTCLVIVGAHLNKTGDSIENDTKNDTKRMAWVTTLAQPNCCVEYDSKLDGTDRNSGSGTTSCDITKCTNGIIKQAQAHEYIENFQDADKNEYNTDGSLKSVVATESFLISGEELSSFFKNGGHSNIAKYLQFYLGYKAGTTAPDSLVLYIVGVSAHHRHVLAVSKDPNTGNKLYSVFNECLPCPICNVNYDGSVDTHRQYNGSSYTKFAKGTKRNSGQKQSQLDPDRR